MSTQVYSYEVRVYNVRTGSALHALAACRPGGVSVVREDAERCTVSFLRVTAEKARKMASHYRNTEVVAKGGEGDVLFAHDYVRGEAFLVGQPQPYELPASTF